jgi:hypothetical protein
MTSVAGLPVCWQYFSSFSASCVAKFTVIRFTAHFLLVIIMLSAVCLHHQKEQLTQEEDDKIIRVCVKKQAMPLALNKVIFLKCIDHCPIKYENRIIIVIAKISHIFWQKQLNQQGVDQNQTIKFYKSTGDTYS